MKRALFLAFLLLPFAALAQSETCPRVWRSGDSLLTDPAPAIQWLRDGQAIPGANERWHVPTEAGSYAVEVQSGLSVSLRVQLGMNYTLAGFVFDDLHRPVAGATVKRGPFAATTDSSGHFALTIFGAKPSEETPVVVSVEKAGYWRNASRQYVSAFDTTETRIMLHTRRVTNRVDATKGGEMAYQGFTLQLPPNAVQTESGTPYSGTILLNVEGSTPSNPDFGLRMPGGSFDATDANGNDVMLYSYGFLSAEMTTEGGERLELRPEARATLRFYLPWNETHRPDSVPLWHFNTEKAIWEQEGWSVRNGSIYEGQVSHFSSWNLDVPAERSTCKGRVVDCNDEPVKGGWVRVGQRDVLTDSSGNYWSFVPGGIEFDTWAAVDTLREITIGAGEERTLEDLTGTYFSGIAAYNSQTQTLNVYMSGVVPPNLRLSIDGGRSWTSNREWTSVLAAPNEIRLDGGCTDRLRIITLPKPEDCRKLSSSELTSAPIYRSWEEAISSEESVSRIGRIFGIRWDLLSSFTCLQSLDFRNMGLRSLSASIGSLTSLQELRLGANSLASIPESIGNLTALRSLDLSENSFTSLPESIGNLTYLESLNLYFNQLTSLPESIGNLTALQELYLYDLRLTSLPEGICNLTALQGLDLRGSNLTSLPESFGNLAALQTLDLDDHAITSLPESFGNLAALQTLILGSNNLTALPENFGNLAALQTLSLNHNAVTSLPESFGNLAALQTLSLNHNAVASLPESFGNLAALQTLDLNDNAVTSLPESFGNLAALQSLFLNSNMLTALPASIGNLAALQFLELDNNQLTDLPASIANLADTLRAIYLRDNPIPVERRAAIQAMLPNTRIFW